MLRIKYFEKFKGEFLLLVVLCDKEGMQAAYNYFKDSEKAFLHNSNVVEYSNISPLTDNMLFMNSAECTSIAEHFSNLLLVDEPRHAYFDIEALGDEVEVMLTYKEYGQLF